MSLSLKLANGTAPVKSSNPRDTTASGSFISKGVILPMAGLQPERTQGCPADGWTMQAGLPHCHSVVQLVGSPQHPNRPSFFLPTLAFQVIVHIENPFSLHIWAWSPSWFSSSFYWCFPRTGVHHLQVWLLTRKKVVEASGSAHPSVNLCMNLLLH